MVEPKSAEELALGMLRDECHRAKFYRKYAQSVAYEVDCAWSVHDRLALRSAANRWHQVSSDHRRNVSALANIIRAIRADKEETDTNPQTRDEMTSKRTPLEKRGNFLIIHDIPRGVRSAISIPLLTFISVETGVEIWAGSANTMTVAGWTIDEILDLIEGPEPVRRSVPAEVEFDEEEITRIVDAAVDRIIKEHFPDIDKTTPLKPR